MRLSTLLVLGLGCAALVPNTTIAQSIDDDARVVELRSSCLVDGTMLDNCFETSADLADWLWGTGAGTRPSAPNSLDPVTVHVGPGNFDRLKCVGPSEGWVSVLGSGREQTRFVQDDPNTWYDPEVGQCPGSIDMVDCTGMTFQDLTAEGFVRGVNWNGNGSSHWRDVDIIADSKGLTSCKVSGFTHVFAWYDQTALSTAQNFFWNVRFIARRPPPGFLLALVPFGGTGVDNWFYSCDFLLDLTGASGTGRFLEAAIVLTANAQAHLFGSTVRVKQPNGIPPPFGGPATGVLLNGNNKFHMHGGIINVNVAAQDRDVAAIRTTGTASGLVHTPETAFSVRESVGSVTSWRIKNDGTVNIMSPFQWPASTTAPNLNSVHGQDTFVKTNAGAGGDETRLFVYDESCGTLWRDAGGSGCL